jgi:hypothetical protein
MLTTRLTHPYDWVFGRAFVTGRTLQKAVRWNRVKELATCFDDRTQPDVRAWLEGLPDELRARAVKVLGQPTTAWA